MLAADSSFGFGSTSTPHGISVFLCGVIFGAGMGILLVLNHCLVFQVGSFLTYLLTGFDWLWFLRA